MRRNHGLAFLLTFSTLGIAAASDVVWTIRDTAVDGSDIRLDGRSVYAYTCAMSNRFVNGLAFAGFDGGGSDLVGDITFSASFYAAGDAFCPESDTWTGSQDYRKLLNGGWYYSNGYKPGTYTLTFNGLTAGRRYLIQIWVCDVRETDKRSQTARIGDVEGNKYGQGAGVNFTGTFTAEAASETVEMAFSSEALINAIQVRCLDEASVDWVVCKTSGESDVRTEGALLYAYKASDALTVNGVPFSRASASVTDWGADMSFSPAIGSAHAEFCWSDESVPSGSYSYSPAYARFVGCGFYTAFDSRKRRDITLRRLVPGLRYLVQIWHFDNRDSVYSNRSVLYDNAACVSNSFDGVKYGHGSYAVGTFTAVTDVQTIRTFGRKLGGTGKTEEMFGPVQVRCLDAENNVFTTGTTAADGSVDTRGSTVYAYAASATAVSGVNFRAFARRGDQFGDFQLLTNGVVRGAVAQETTTFLNEATVPVSSVVTNLLGGALYKDDGFEMNEVRLGRLTPGRRYLVQAWFTDTRVANGTSKSVIFGGATARYLDSENAPLGQYVTGIFRATNSVHAVMMKKVNFYLNALQVRELGTPFSGEAEWTLCATAAGEASVLTEGTLLYAFAPKAFQLENGVAFTAASTTVTNWGPDCVTLSQKYGQVFDKYGSNGQEDAPIASLLNNGWYQGTSGLSCDYDITLRRLKPGHAYAVQLFVSDLRGNGCGIRRIYVYDLFGRYGESTAPYGTTCIGRFTASGERYSFQVRYDGIGSSQLNAIQVRDLGPAGVVWCGGATGTWTTDGTGWTCDGVSQEGTALWAADAARTALIEGDVMLSLGTDVAAQGVFGTGHLTIGEAGTDKSLTVVSEVSAPTATVQAVWGSTRVDKTLPGRLVLTGACPDLFAVNVFNGSLVLAGATSRPLAVTVGAPGRLAFDEMTALAFHSLSGDGVLAGPGGIVLSSGDVFTVPASLSTADGFAWGLADGTVLALPDGTDAARVRVRIDDPSAYRDQVVVKALGAVTGRPDVVFSEDGFRTVWDETRSGWKVVASAFAVIVR